MEGNTIAKWMIFLGIAIIILGLMIWIGSRFGVDFGKFPGDFKVQREKFILYFPLVTSLFLSLILTIVINLILWLFRR